MIALLAIWNKWVMAEKTSSRGSSGISAEWSHRPQKNGSFSGEFQSVIVWSNDSTWSRVKDFSWLSGAKESVQRQGHRGHGSHSLHTLWNAAKKVLNITHMLVHECRSRVQTCSSRKWPLLSVCTGWRARPGALLLSETDVGAEIEQALCS